MNKLKQYIVHCLDDEKPSKAKLISMVLEGLENWTLYAHLYACQHRTFNESCLDAMDFDENIDASNQEHNRKIKQTSHSNDSSSRYSNANKIVETILKQLGQTYRPPYHSMRYQQDPTPSPTIGPYMCGICVKPQKIELRMLYMPGLINCLQVATVKCVDGMPCRL